MYGNETMVAKDATPRQDPMESMTCGQNLERKIDELEERLAKLRRAREEMLDTGLYDVRISTIQAAMLY